MHHIVKVTKSGYVICGDKRIRLERDITDKDIVGDKMLENRILCFFMFKSCVKLNYMELIKNE